MPNTRVNSKILTVVQNTKYYCGKILTAERPLCLVQKLPTSEKKWKKPINKIVYHRYYAHKTPSRP